MQAEPRTLRAASNLVVAPAAPDHTISFMGCVPIPLAWAKSMPPWCVFSSVLTINTHTIKTTGATSAVQVVDRVGEHALVTLPTRNLSNLLGELNRVSLAEVLFHTLCTPPDASRSFQFGDDVVVDGVGKEVTFTTGMTFNQSYWWAPVIYTPVATLEADRIARVWMTYAEPGANNFFYGLVPDTIGAAADAVVDMVAKGDSAGTPSDDVVAHDDEEEIEVAPSGEKRGEGGATTEGDEMIDSFGGPATFTDVSGRRL